MNVIFKIRCVKTHGVQFYNQTFGLMSVHEVKQDSQKSFRKVLEEIHYLQHLQHNIYSNERKYIFVNIDFFK